MKKFLTTIATIFISSIFCLNKAEAKVFPLKEWMLMGQDYITGIREYKQEYIYVQLSSLKPIKTSKKLKTRLDYSLIKCKKIVKRISYYAWVIKTGELTTGITEEYRNQSNVRWIKVSKSSNASIEKHRLNAKEELNGYKPIFISPNHKSACFIKKTTQKNGKIYQDVKISVIDLEKKKL